MMENFYLGTCRRCAGLLTYALLLASPLKDIMVHVAETTAFLDKKKKKKKMHWTIRKIVTNTFLQFEG